MAFLELDHVSVVFPAVQGLLSSRKPASVCTDRKKNGRLWDYV